MLGIQVNHNQITQTFFATQNVGEFFYQFKEAEK